MYVHVYIYIYTSVPKNYLQRPHMFPDASARIELGLSSRWLCRWWKNCSCFGWEFRGLGVQGVGVGALGNVGAN